MLSLFSWLVAILLSNIEDGNPIAVEVLSTLSWMFFDLGDLVGAREKQNQGIRLFHWALDYRGGVLSVCLSPLGRWPLSLGTFLLAADFSRNYGAA